MFALGVSAFGLAYGGFAVGGTSIVFLGACFAAAGIGIGCAETAEHAAVATFARDEIRGSAFGFLAATQSIGNLAASAIVGLLYTYATPTIAFSFAAAMMFLSLIIMSLTRE